MIIKGMLFNGDPVLLNTDFIKTIRPEFIKADGACVYGIEADIDVPIVKSAMVNLTDGGCCYLNQSIEELEEAMCDD
jgi:hypothetical protein